ncbi:hypothetical protein HanRHA438_Chr11g0483531 [Helianthus annuus]|nr:hypothetical protein HanRHA438_Chr11g0483531 [Helianthus annuus]
MIKFFLVTVTTPWGKLMGSHQYHANPIFNPGTSKCNRFQCHLANQLEKVLEYIRVKPISIRVSCYVYVYLKGYGPKSCADHTSQPQVARETIPKLNQIDNLPDLAPTKQMCSKLRARPGPKQDQF